eukprot:6200953-Pleurochrysis_carterae.AAC.2
MNPNDPQTQASAETPCFDAAARSRRVDAQHCKSRTAVRGPHQIPREDVLRVTVVVVNQEALYTIRDSKRFSANGCRHLAAMVNSRTSQQPDKGINDGDGARQMKRPWADSFTCKADSIESLRISIYQLISSSLHSGRSMSKTRWQ